MNPKQIRPYRTTVAGIEPTVFDAGGLPMLASAGSKDSLASVVMIQQDSDKYPLNSGVVSATNHGLTIGGVYYLSQDTPGMLIDSMPLTGYVQKILTVLSDELLQIDLELISALDLDRQPPEDTLMATSVMTHNAVSATISEFDAEQSTHDNVPAGAASGVHFYNIHTTKLVVDNTVTGDPVNLEAGANVSFNATDQLWEKNVAGNTWNASVRSTGVIFDPSTENCMLSWPVEASSTGTVREMAGFDNQPDANDSYTSGEYFIYQVNATTVYIYEKGSNRHTKARSVVPGDRYGISVVDGVVTYLHIRDEVVTELYTSAVLATEPMYFKAALNRGNTSSGWSKIGDVRINKTANVAPTSAYVHGNALSELSDEHKKALIGVGYQPLPNTKYSRLQVERMSVPSMDANRQYEVTHAFAVMNTQTTVNV